VPRRVGGIGLGLEVVIGCLATAALVFTATRPNRDHRWTLALLSGILFAPLGWTHYLPLIAPALVALWAERLWNTALTVGILLLCIPPNLGYGETAGSSWIGGVTLGSLYNFASVLLWIGVAISSTNRRTSGRI
jgi:hypothetical protein